MSAAPTCVKCSGPAVTTVADAADKTRTYPVCKRHQPVMLAIGYQPGPELGAEHVGEDGGSWERKAWMELLALAREGRRFTAEDLRDRAGDPPIDNMIGALIGTASRAGIISEAGTTTPRRAERHGSRLLVWIGSRPRAARTS